ncbi:MAG: PAS domain S-box protein [Thermodesulfobacteriota bacterium]|nr:PAS domain S-box protein [Thermodesulfobacteriota bacterium]
MGNPIQLSDELARLFLENTSSMVAVFDKKARFLYLNSPNEAGYTPAALQGKNALSLIHPDDRDRMVSLMANAFDKRLDKIQSLTYRVINKQGQVRHVQATFDTVRDASGNLDKLLCVADDITEKVKIRTAFVESGQRPGTGHGAGHRGPAPGTDQDCQRTGEWYHFCPADTGRREQGRQGCHGREDRGGAILVVIK